MEHDYSNIHGGFASSYNSIDSMVQTAFWLTRSYWEIASHRARKKEIEVDDEGLQVDVALYLDEFPLPWFYPNRMKRKRFV